MDLGLRNAKAVVVGGSRGMGRAAAQCLADDGARVAVFARSHAELDAVVADPLAQLREALSPVGGAPTPAKRSRRKAGSTDTTDPLPSSTYLGAVL